MFLVYFQTSIVSLNLLKAQLLRPAVTELSRDEIKEKMDPKIISKMECFVDLNRRSKRLTAVHCK